MHCDQITNPNQTRLSLNLTSCHSWATFPIMTPILQRLWHSVWDGIWGSCQHGYQAVERPRPCYSSDFTSITLSAHFLSSGAAILTVTIKPLSKNYTPSLPPSLPALHIYCSSRWTISPSFNFCLCHSHLIVFKLLLSSFGLFYLTGLNIKIFFRFWILYRFSRNYFMTVIHTHTYSGGFFFDLLLILYICPQTKKWSVYNFNGRFFEQWEAE